MGMRRLAVLIAAALALVPAARARAGILIAIDKSAQQMTVSVDGEQLYVWPVSTGIARYDTPNGAYTPFRMERDHYSREWDDAPMPYSIFFTKQGHAIHGSYHRGIGQPASHGCVRLSVANAATLYGLVREQGKANTMVVLTGEIPDHAAPAMASNEDDETAADAPPPRWRAYRARPRYFYYRGRLYYPARRYYYRYGGTPFFLFGR
jgi:L,D-transpeptidase catalytic domain